MNVFQAQPTRARAAKLGEGPIWYDDLLWYVDIEAGRLIWFNPENDSAAEWTYDHPVACLAPCEGGFIAGTGRGFSFLEPGQKGLIIQEILDDPALRMNDGTIDRQGRVIAGSMDRTDARGSIHIAGRGILKDGLRTANGLAVSPDGQTLYWSDSHPSVRKVWCAPYDPVSCEIGSPEIFRDFANDPGRPDGAAIDAEGGYWIAAIDSGRVLRLDADGQVDAVVELPAAKPTKPVFGGRDLHTMFITTIDAGDGGLVYSVRLPYRGLPAVSASLAHLQ